MDKNNSQNFQFSNFEEGNIEKLKNLFVDINQRKLIDRNLPPAPRAVFRKQHGIVIGKFSVLPNSEHLEKFQDQDLGLFNYNSSDVERNSYECILRFSSDTDPTKPDLDSTIGIGLKVFGGNIINDCFSGKTADFIFQNIDRFFVQDATEMCAFTSASLIDRDVDGYLDKNPKTKTILDDMAHHEGSCLYANYWTILPFRFGNDAMVKYRLRPVAMESVHPIEDKNYLATDLYNRLLNDEYKFHLEVQIKDYDKTAGDDLQNSWSEEYIAIAELVLPKQNIKVKGLAEFGDYLNFNCWRLPTVNLPFGSIANARREVYRYSADTRYSANGWNTEEPESITCPYSNKSLQKDTVIVKAAIYPPIGVTRVGNSDEYYLGPLIPEPQKKDNSFYRDRYGRLKRQAAEFRIYGLNARGEAIKELTKKDAQDNIEIKWLCHLANQKAAWYEFQIALDVPEAKTYPASNKRNLNVEDRKSLVIDGKPQFIDCTSEQQTAKHFEAKYSRSFVGTCFNQETSVYLGEMFVKHDTDRLYLLGGKGVAKSIDDELAITFANNDGWYDDTSDGPVRAEVNYNGKFLQVEPAWVICGPPDYAPMQKSVRTMWDLMRDLAIENKMMARPQQPSFAEDIFPIFKRMTDLQWVNKGFSEMFGEFGPFCFDDQKWIDKLRDGSNCNLEFRRLMYNQFRQFELPGSQSPALWPWIYGDSVEIPAYDSPRQHSTLSKLQLGFLRQWMHGEFIDDWDQNLKEAKRSLDDYPIKKQPDLLTKAALDYCLADAFHPGCEITWPVRHISMYRAPFRFTHEFRTTIDDIFAYKKTITSYLDYGPTIDSNILLATNNPFEAQVAGGITRWMAIPWQTDTSSCRDGYDTTYDPYVPTFWPARVPNNILGYEQYQNLQDKHLSSKEIMEEFQYRKEWLEDLPGSPNRYTDYREVINKMVTNFDRVGVVLPQEIDVEKLPNNIQIAFPKTVQHLGNLIYDLLPEQLKKHITVEKIAAEANLYLKGDMDKIGNLIDYFQAMTAKIVQHGQLLSDQGLEKMLFKLEAEQNIFNFINSSIELAATEVPIITYVKPGEKVITISERFRQQFQSK